MMSTSFSTSPKDWDSDGDEDSSEEFMYVKGTEESTSKGQDSDTNIATNTISKDQDPNTASSVNADNTEVTESEVWNAHTDQIMVSPTASM